MSKLIDDRNKVVYEGSLESCQHCLHLADCDPSEVTEIDEMLYGNFLESS